MLTGFVRILLSVLTTLAGVFIRARVLEGDRLIFFILPFSTINLSRIKIVWHIWKILFVIARFSESLIGGNKPV